MSRKSGVVREYSFDRHATHTPAHAQICKARWGQGMGPQTAGSLARSCSGLPCSRCATAVPKGRVAGVGGVGQVPPLPHPGPLGGRRGGLPPLHRGGPAMSRSRDPSRRRKYMREISDGGSSGAPVHRLQEALCCDRPREPLVGHELRLSTLVLPSSLAVRARVGHTLREVPGSLSRVAAWPMPEVPHPSGRRPDVRAQGSISPAPQPSLGLPESSRRTRSGPRPASPIQEPEA